MLKTLKTAWRVADVRKKILFTLMVIVVFRLGCSIVVPFVNTSLLAAYMASMSGTMLGIFNVLSGGAFSSATLFALGVQPYINASIIIQLLCVAIPALKRIQKEEGERGEKKMKRITYAASAGIGLLQSIGYYAMLRNYGLLSESAAGWLPAVVIVACLLAGSAFITWLAELCTKKGIGNGVSIIIFVGILSRVPSGIATIASGVSAWVSDKTTGASPLLIAALLACLAALLVLIVVVNAAERRIPIQYAKRRQGNRTYGGQSTYLPLKLSMTGVLPVIFAQSILSLPLTIWAFIGTPDSGTVGSYIYNLFAGQGALYIALYGALIFAFSYFYASIQMDPIEISNNLRKNGGFVPGYRPGTPTATLIRNTLKGVVLFGAVYLAVVSLCPLILDAAISASAISIGGTSIIIVVGVALETVEALSVEMAQYSYGNLLKTA